MEFLRVGMTKLKIALTKSESEKYNVSASEGEFNRIRIRDTINSILEEAKDRCNFEIGDEKVLIQVYPGSDGGCELFLTKLSFLADEEKRCIVKASNISTLERASSAFRFSCLEDLIFAARSLKDRPVKSDVYYSDDGEYYIQIREHSIDGVNCAMVLYEFAERISEIPFDVKSERGRLLVGENALSVFAEL